MSKSKKTLSAASKAVDPTLAALFASSSGTVQAPAKSRYPALLVPKQREAKPTQAAQAESTSLEESDSDENEVDSQDDADSNDASESSDKLDETSEDEDATDGATAVVEIGVDLQRKERKRKRKADTDGDDLEGKYLQKVMAAEEHMSKKLRGDGGVTPEEEPVPDDDESGDSSDGDVPVHESLTKDGEVTELEKASRTVFLSNVSTEAIKTKSGKTAIITHLSSVLDKTAKPAQRVETIRFRSVAFSSGSMPKRAAYITKQVMDATTKSANAYAVFSTAAAARLAVNKLNGSMVLDRHLRVDSVAHPAAVDHRRCVFIGNLGFIDDESIIKTEVDEEGNEKTEKRKRNKSPMDVEEGLWRTFGKHAGKVESVRVVRDQGTRVGKGIAYVQFYDTVAVEAALQLAGKRFPPMLPRELRVSRCKAPHKTARAIERSGQGKVIAPAGGKGKNANASGYVRKRTADEQTMAGRTGKLLGHAAASRTTEGGKKDGARNGRGNLHSKRDVTGDAGFKTPEAIIFEGRRASAKDGKPKDLKFKGANKNKVNKRSSNNQKRRAARSAQWRGSKGES